MQARQPDRALRESGLHADEVAERLPLLEQPIAVNEVAVRRLRIGDDRFFELGVPRDRLRTQSSHGAAEIIALSHAALDVIRSVAFDRAS